MGFIKNDSAISYGLVIFAVVLVFFMAMIIEVTPFLNVLINIFNDRISSGLISQQAADAFNFTIDMKNFIIFAFVLGSIVWLYVRAIEQKEVV